MPGAVEPIEAALPILDAIDDPVVVLDRDGLVLHRNRAARLRLTSIVPGRTLPPPCSEGSARLAAYLSLCGTSPGPVAETLELGPGARRFRCRGNRIERGPHAQGCVLLHLVPERESGPDSVLHRRASDLLDAACRREQAERERDQVLIRIYRANQEERLRLARDLHDQTGQHIVGLALGIKALERHVSTPVGLAEIGRLRERLDDVARELHRIAFELRPTALDDFGLSVALRRLLADWGVGHGIATAFEATGTEFELASEVEITLFRLCQEALTNISKHAAGAGHVTIALQYEGSAVSLIVEDDGAGCPEEALSTSRLIAGGKFGIVGMRERVGLVAGTFEIESSPGAGTTLVARIGNPGGRP